MQAYIPITNHLALLDVALTIVCVVGQVLRAGEGLQTVEDAELSKLVQDEQYVLALFCKSTYFADPDPWDPYVFGPLVSGTGSVSQMYGSGSRSFYLQAEKERKTLDSYYL
jgi:hypothetical protein